MEQTACVFKDDDEQFQLSESLSLKDFFFGNVGCSRTGLYIIEPVNYTSFSVL